ncbi:hypothetical protein TNCT_415771 [Trichonephila clavata]|uniref:Uncharacterized protein n=1 Tax=Trichonephila clavata TaxID=2740835 RepID=A0A8X6KJV9_TRICU|nr:hypothetical protein TNCT_415771 [Trichonephila clavata]
MDYCKQVLNVTEKNVFQKKVLWYHPREKQVFFQNMHKEHSKTYIMHANIASFASDTVQKTNAFEIGSWNSEDCFPGKIADEDQSSASTPSGE